MPEGAEFTEAKSVPCYQKPMVVRVLDVSLYGQLGFSTC